MGSSAGAREKGEKRRRDLNSPSTVGGADSESHVRRIRFLTSNEGPTTRSFSDAAEVRPAGGKNR